MFSAGTAIAIADGADEHELQEMAPLQDYGQRQQQIPVDMGPHVYPMEVGRWPVEEADHPPPLYQAAREQNGTAPRPWPQLPRHDQDQLVLEQRRRDSAHIDREAGEEGERARLRARCKHPILYAFAFFMLACSLVAAVLLIWDLLTERNLYDTKDPQTSPNVTVRQLPRKISSMTLLAVPGLYIIPSNVPHATWLQVEDGSSKDRRWNESLKLPSDSKTSNAFHISEFRQDSRGFLSHEVSNGSAIVERQEQEQFDFWGIEILYNLHPRASMHTMQVKKTWCVNHTCSVASKLSALCNDTGKDPKKIKKKDYFQQKECDWCWNEALFPGKNSTQDAEIEKHCEEVSRHAALFLTVVCAIFLFFILTLTTILITRMFLRRKKARRAAAFDPNGPINPPAYDGSGENVQRRQATPKLRPSYFFVRGRRNKTSHESSSQIQLQNRGSTPKGNPEKTAQDSEFGGTVFDLPAAKGRVQANGATAKDKSNGFSRRSSAFSLGSEHIPMDTVNRQAYVTEQEEDRTNAKVEVHAA